MTGYRIPKPICSALLQSRAGVTTGASQVAQWLKKKKKKSACQRRRCRRYRFDPWVGKVPCRREWQPTPVFLPGESHGQRNLAGYSPWGCKILDTTKNTHMGGGVVTTSVFNMRSCKNISFYMSSLPSHPTAQRTRRKKVEVLK